MASKTLEREPNFRRCPRCQAGQLHEIECSLALIACLTLAGEIFICFNCNYRRCFRCAAEFLPVHDQHVCPFKDPLGFPHSTPETFQDLPRTRPNDGDGQRKRKSGPLTSNLAKIQSSDRAKGKHILTNFSEQQDGAEGDEPERPRDPLSQNDMDITGDEKSFIEGIVVIIDDQGWKQKIRVSYDLTVRSYAPVGSDCENRVFSSVKMPWVEVSVPESTFAGREFRAPQFSIQQITILLRPSVDQIPEEQRHDNYTDSWTANNPYPTVSTHGPSRKSVTTDASIRLAAGGFSPMPTVTIGAERIWGRSHHIASELVGIDESKSSIGVETALGGIKWKYHLLKDSSPRSRSRFESHGGKISLSKFFPSSINATVSTILETNGSEPSTFSREVCRGIAIGYRHIAVVMQTDVMWNETSYAQFPCHNVPGGHEVNLTHQLRGRPGNWTAPPKRVFANNGRLETELSLRGIRDPAREAQTDQDA